MRNQNTRTLAQLAILIALLAVLTFTPIGFIMVPPVSITLMHIPVIVGAMLMGPKQGGVLGLAFGLFSMIKASTAAASPVDMAFSPVLSGEPVASLVLCLLPRVLLGVVAGLLYGLLSRKMKGDAPAMAVTAVVSSFFHTAAVMGLLWVLFQALPLKSIIMTVVSVNSLLEALAAGILATAVCKAVKRTSKAS